MSKVTIDRLGDLGDGVVDNGKASIFVQCTITGEAIEINEERPHAGLTKVIDPSPERVDPLCRHFRSCGNCAVQHISTKSILDWKRKKVTDAFSRANVNAEVEPCIASSPHSRRRVTFTAKRDGKDVVLGFKGRASVELVAISECPILVPEIETMLEPLTKLAATLVRGAEEIQLAVTALSNGLDLDILVEQDLSEDMAAGFVRAFSRSPLLRASVNGEVIAEKEKPFVRFGIAEVSVPPGGFLQAAASAEEAMAELVCRHLKKCKRVADLFAGSGTFALRLATVSNVHAVETEQLALAALSTASGADGLRPVTTETRDLFDLPLMASELKRFDGICLDPPRAGAETQVKEIAKSDVRSVAYVSCNPKTLAKDAAVLVAGGYELERAIPIDQFVFSHHVEVVALFSKKSKARRSIFR